MAGTDHFRQWQDKTVLALGIAVLLSPWFLDFWSVDVAAWNAYILGAFVTFWALVGLLIHAYWPMFLIAYGGAWLILSQKILAFTDHTIATISVMVFGAAIALIAMWGAVAQANRENA